MSDDRAARIAQARDAAEKIRELWPDKAAVIDGLIAKAEDGLVDMPRVQVSIGARLEKFDGDIEPGKQPVEVLDLRG